MTRLILLALLLASCGHAPRPPQDCRTSVLYFQYPDMTPVYYTICITETP